MMSVARTANAPYQVFRSQTPHPAPDFHRPCGIHPQYRKRGIQKFFLDALIEDYYPEQDICITTYRKGDRADTGYRKELQKLGFAERELLIEFGYPTQRFVLTAKMFRNK